MQINQLFIMLFFLVLCDTLSATSLFLYKDSNDYPDQAYVKFAASHTFEILNESDVEKLKDFALQGHRGAIQSYLDLKPNDDGHLKDFIEKLPSAAYETVVATALDYLNLDPSYKYLSDRRYERLDRYTADFRGLHILYLLESKGAYVRGQRVFYALALMWFSESARQVLDINEPEHEAVKQFSKWYSDTLIETPEDENLHKQFIQLLSLRAALCGENIEKMQFYINAMQMFTPREDEEDPKKQPRSMTGYIVAALAIPVLYVGHSVFQSFNNQ